MSDLPVGEPGVAGGPGGPADPAPTPAEAVAAPRDQVLRVELSWNSVWRAIVAILLTMFLLRVGRAASGLLGILGISFFFSLALDPAVRNLHRRFGWRRGAAVGVIYAAGILFVVFLVAVLIPAIGQLADQISANFGQWVANMREWSEATFGIPVPDESVAGQGDAAGDVIGGFVDDPFGTIVGVASRGVGLIFSLATIAMFTFYFTADAPRIQRAVLRLFSAKNQERIGWTWDQAIVQTGGYFYSRMLLMLINGLGFFVTMAFVGVPIGFALSLSVFGAFVSVFIPAVGTYIGGAVPVALTLAFEGLVAALVVLAYVLVYQQIENYWLSPKISANTMSLNGGVAFGAALAGGAIGGPMGAFVALPVAALISSTISNYAASYEVVYASSLDDDEDEEGDGAEAGDRADKGNGRLSSRLRRRRHARDDSEPSADTGTPHTP